jgi:hypothetical protein
LEFKRNADQKLQRLKLQLLDEEEFKLKAFKDIVNERAEKSKRLRNKRNLNKSVSEIGGGFDYEAIIERGRKKRI